MLAIDIGPFHFTPTVLIWTLIALVASILTWVNLQDAKGDRRAVERIGGNKLAARVLAADGLVRRDRVRLITFGIWFALGLIAAYVGWGNGNSDIPRGTFIVTGLITTALVQLYASYMDQRDRHGLMKEIEEIFAQDLLRQAHAKSENDHAPH